MQPKGTDPQCKYEMCSLPGMLGPGSSEFFDLPVLHGGISFLADFRTNWTVRRPFAPSQIAGGHCCIRTPCAFAYFSSSWLLNQQRRNLVELKHLLLCWIDLRLFRIGRLSPQGRLLSWPLALLCMTSGQIETAENSRKKWLLP